MPNASNTVSAGPAAVEVRGAHTPRPGPTAIPLTPPQAGAIGVIAVCGDPEAAERVVARICTQSDPKLPPIGGVHLCNFHHGNRVFDRGLLIRRNSAMFELHLHGGTAVIDMALAALAQAGANVTREPPGELPAACNIWGNQAGPTVLFQECLQAICLANSSFTLEIAAGQLTGGITRWSTLWLARLENTAVAAVDLLWKIHTESQWILNGWPEAVYLWHKPRIVLFGPPNAGKSTLANALCGRSASIVSDAPGTTRDWVDATFFLTWGDVSLAATLVDTAGIRETSEAIESESIARAHEQMERADILLAVVDGAAPLDPSVEAQLHRVFTAPNEHSPRQPPMILVVNKSDLPQCRRPAGAWAAVRTVSASALQGEGIPALHQSILQVLGITRIGPATPVVWTRRQRMLLESLISAVDIAAAREFLRALIGDDSRRVK